MTARHVAVLTIPATGHTLPVLDVVTELRARGHRVTHLTTSAFAAMAQAAGAEVVTYGSTLVSRPAGPAPPGDLAMWLPFVLVAEADAVVPQILAALQHDVPDVLLYDRAAYPTARALAQRWDRPAVVLYASFAQGPAWSLAEATAQHSVLDPAHPAYGPLQEALDTFTGRWQVERIGVEALSQAREARAIAFLPRRFQPHGDAFGAAYHFVGPCLASRLASADRISEDPPRAGGTGADGPGHGLVYVSAGTTATDPAALRRLAGAVTDAVPGRRVVLSTGGLPAGEVAGLPPRVEVHERVDQVAVLARAAAFVTHAGMGGVMEALWFGVPLLCVPRTTEQQLVADRVDQLGLGRSLAAGAGDLADGALLGDELVRLLADDRLPGRLRDMAGAVRAAGGAAAAADVTESVLTG